MDEGEVSGKTGRHDGHGELARREAARARTDDADRQQERHAGGLTRERRTASPGPDLPPERATRITSRPERLAAARRTRNDPVARRPSHSRGRTYCMPACNPEPVPPPPRPKPDCMPWRPERCCPPFCPGDTTET